MDPLVIFLQSLRNTVAKQRSSKNKDHLISFQRLIAQCFPVWGSAGYGPKGYIWEVNGHFPFSSYNRAGFIIGYGKHQGQAKQMKPRGPL